MSDTNPTPMPVPEPVPATPPALKAESRPFPFGRPMSQAELEAP